MADVLPFDVPARSDLWYRVQLARSVLTHRPSTPENWALLTAILNGATIDDLMHPTGGAA